MKILEVMQREVIVVSAYMFNGDTEDIIVENDAKDEPYHQVIRETFVEGQFTWEVVSKSAKHQIRVGHGMYKDEEVGVNKLVEVHGVFRSGVPEGFDQTIRQLAIDTYNKHFGDQ